VVRVRLEAEDNQRALEAYREGSQLAVSGSLERERHYFWLDHMTGFLVVQADVHSDSPAQGLFEE
jgi:hypothetical protein